MPSNLIEVTCPKCDHTFTTKAPKIQRRGKGAWYASKIKRLGITRQLALEVMRDHKCFSFDSGEDTGQIWEWVRNKILYSNETKGTRWKIPTKHGFSGRLSELQGKKLVTSPANLVKLTYEEQMKFRGVPHASERWWVTELGMNTNLESYFA